MPRTPLRSAGLGVAIHRPRRNHLSTSAAAVLFGASVGRPMLSDMTESTTAPACHNEVVLVGRVSAAPEERELPSGDHLLTLRVVVDRPAEKRATKRAVDVIDVACWSRRVQRTAAALAPADLVRVEGALRRRFFAAAGVRTSRYEVEASRVVRLNRPSG